jgi:glycosyltransferase involved in cell wall biosynthesis
MNGNTSQPPIQNIIAFTTSVTGFGGSEVLIADAMAAAHDVTGNVVCLCDKSSHIRRIFRTNYPDKSCKFIDLLTGRDHSDNRSSVADHEPVGPGRNDPLRRFLRCLIPVTARRFLGFYKEACQVRDVLAKINPQAVFVNINGFEAAAYGASGLKPGRTIGCYHLSVAENRGSSIQRLLQWHLLRRTMWSASVVVHTSRAVMKQWCDLTGFPTSRCRVIYNGVESFAEPEAGSGFDESWRTSPDTFVFCIPARLHPIKGHAVLFQALVGVRDRLGNSKVLIAGTGPIEAELKSLAAQLHLDDIVVFLGFRQDLPLILSRCDCAVLSSVESENLSVAILEAMMAGKPVITSNVGGMAEAVEDEVTGLVTPIGDANALGEALVRMVEDPERTRLMGQASRDRARAMFTIERMLEEYRDLFRDIVR